MANGTKYFWLKLDKNFFKKPEIQILENMTGGKDFELFYLKLLCESTGHEGRLRLNETIPYNTTMLASVTNTPEVTVKEAIGHLTDLGLMTLLDDGTFFMNEVEKMVGSETDWAKKKRKQRLDAVEGDNVPKLSPKCPIEIEKEIDIEKEKEKEIKKKKPPVYFPDDEELETVFQDYLKLRKKIKAVNSERAINLLGNKLNKMASPNGYFDREIAIQLLNQSIENSWKTIYPLKENKKSNDVLGAIKEYAAERSMNDSRRMYEDARISQNGLPASNEFFDF